MLAYPGRSRLDNKLTQLTLIAALAPLRASLQLANRERSREVAYRESVPVVRREAESGIASAAEKACFVCEPKEMEASKFSPPPNMLRRRAVAL